MNPGQAWARLSASLRWPAVTALVLAARWAWPPRGMDATGWVALRDLALTLALWILVLALAHRSGARVLRRLSPPVLTHLEHFIFSLSLGLGVVGCALFVLGLLHVLRIEVISALLLILSGLPSTASQGRGSSFREIVRSLKSAWSAWELPSRFAAVLAVLIAVLAFFHALSPPWDYDGLMYHLVGPKLFLSMGGLVPYPANWYVNAPFLLEMVFAVGMAFGDDIFPKLVHFATSVVLVMATYAAGRRWLGAPAARTATWILLGIPVLPMWAAFAYIDLGWSLFEFLALVAVVEFWQDRDHAWLRLAGVMGGLAMASKYLALAGFALLGAAILVEGLARRRRLPLRALLEFGVIAGVIASPWYLKNLVWFGNPVFPLYLGGPEWPPERWGLYSAYLQSFGTGRSLLDYLLLPWNVYVRHETFGAVMNLIDVPAFLFPLLVFFPWLPKPRPLGALLILSLARAAVWAAGSQQIRFLLPIYPALAIVTAHVAHELLPADRVRSAWRVFFPTLAAGLMSLTLFYQVVVQVQYAPGRAVLGMESRRSFLDRIVKDHPATQYAQASLPDGSRVLLLGDGRGYYCPDVCLPDPDHFHWARLITSTKDTPSLVAWLEAEGITHILLSIEDLDFLLQHDPKGIMRTALDRVTALREDGCLTEVFDDGWTSIDAVGCGPSP